MTVTDNTAAQLIWPQSRRSDFLRVLEFYDVDPDTGTETAKDLDNFVFTFRVLGLDGSTYISGVIGNGITVAANVVTIFYSKSIYDTTDKVLLTGCTYQSYLEMQTPEEVNKALIDAKIPMTP